jgi:thioredoxin-dependent peroxiredoxin
MRWLSSCLLLTACLASGCAKAGSGTGPEGGLVKEGSVAPAIDAIAHSGERVSLAALKGKPVVIYFYPKDDTPGCTKEACEIRDAWNRFRAAGAVVLGVSTDDPKSHVAFADKYHLPFLLLPDSDERIAKAYGVPIRLGTAKRVTFVIDRQGNVAKVFPDVNPKGHAEEILAAIEKLKT